MRLMSKAHANMKLALPGKRVVLVDREGVVDVEIEDVRSLLTSGFVSLEVQNKELLEETKLETKEESPKKRFSRNRGQE